MKKKSTAKSSSTKKPSQSVKKQVKLKTRSKPFPIAAIGASAGGIEAVTELFRNLRPDTGMAFVYIQHLDPTHESMLTSILSHSTKMKVSEAKNLLRIDPNNVYVIPPNKEMSIIDGVLKLNPRPAKPLLSMSVNRFFLSLAEKQKEGAIGIVLSGNASDGAMGLMAIKNAGGVTFAQDKSAKFQSMPQAAIAQGAADLVLPPAAIAKELERIAGQIDLSVTDKKEAVKLSEMEGLDQSAILNLVKNATGVDFTHYKQSTITRRIIRRMLLFKLRNYKEYANYLRNHAEEIVNLFQDLLINVTCFFRDPVSTDYLKKTLLPQLIKSMPIGGNIRIWVPACSSGEEAYSIAILMLEVINKKNTSSQGIQIFATDLSEAAIGRARLGLYNSADLINVSQARLQRFFTKVDSSYRVAKNVRDLCIFAPHNVVTDPPFSNMDLISCCNLLIYLDPILQNKVISTFHYSLKPGGHLMLGKSETIGKLQNLFTLVEKKVRLYSRKQDTSRKPLFDLTYRLPSSTGEKYEPARLNTKKNQADGVPDIGKMVESILLERYVPPCVVVTSDFEIVQFHGSTGIFLEPASGRASLNLLKMARNGLGIELRSGVYRASKSGQVYKKGGIEIKNRKSTHYVNIEIVPLEKTARDRHFMIIFEEVETPVITGSKAAADKAEIIKHYQEELKRAREDMRFMLEEQEAANEELQSANEEIISSNEELQSINEELETSKEEMESSNEELLTINSEIQMRNEQLAEAYDYGEGVLSTIREAVVILDKSLRVKSANNSFYKIFQDDEDITVGRLIYEIGNRQWDIPALRQLLEDVIPSRSQFFGFKVQHVFPLIGEKIMVLNAKRIVQRIHNEELILLAIEDITEHAMGQRILSEREELFRNMADNAPMLIWVAGTDKNFTYFNSTWLQFTGRKQEQELGDGWISEVAESDKTRIMKIYNEAFDEKKSFKIEFRLMRNDGHYRWMLNMGKPTFDLSGKFTGYIGSCVEIHDKKIMSEELEDRVKERTRELEHANINLERSNKELEQFAYVASHDLQEPLRKIMTFSNRLDQRFKTELGSTGINYLNKIVESSQRMTVLINELLNFSRSARADHNFVMTDLNEVIKDVMKDFELIIQSKKASVVVQPMPVIKAIPLQMQQLFHNLISNALKFTFDNRPPRIEIKSRQLSDHEIPPGITPDTDIPFFEIVVNDNGIGFKEEFADLIFIIFRRLHERDTYEGTGIGLALCKKIVENHQGIIYAKSQDGNGTSFHIILPGKK